MGLTLNPNPSRYVVSQLNGYATRRSMDILTEQSYDNITDLAALICETSTALVSLIDDGQQSIKSKHGIDAED
jgi:hypothetical protein